MCIMSEEERKGKVEEERNPGFQLPSPPSDESMA